MMARLFVFVLLILCNSNSIRVANAELYTVAVKYMLAEGRETCRPFAACRLHQVTYQSLKDAGMDFADEPSWSSYRECVKSKRQEQRDEKFRMLLTSGSGAASQEHRRLCNSHCKALCLSGATNWCDCCSCCGSRRRQLGGGLRQLNRVRKADDDKSLEDIITDAQEKAETYLEQWRRRISCLHYDKDEGYSVEVLIAHEDGTVVGEESAEPSE